MYLLNYIRFGFCLLILLLFDMQLKSQTSHTAYKVVNLKQEQSFYLNSKTRIGGKSRNSLKVDLPENTVQWFYTFTTYLQETEETNGTNNINLTTQLTDMVLKGATSTSAVGVTSTVIQKLIKPTGVGVVDVYLTDYNGYQQFNQKDAIGIWSYSKPGSFSEGSRENAKDATVLIDDVTQKSVYLCFKNPSPMEGVLITLEVAAVVAVREYVDAWTKQNRQRFFDSCLLRIPFKGQKGQKVCNCLEEKITTTYSPSGYDQLTEAKQNSLFQQYLDDCYAETGNTDMKDKTQRLYELDREIAGLQALKDYKGLIHLYEESLALGVENESIYNSLAWNCLLTNQLQKAKTYLRKGISIAPTNLFLQGNLAHYFILNGEYGNAEEIYMKYRKEKLGKKLKWKDAVREDFQLFEKLDLYNDDMDKILSILKIKKW